MNDTCFGVLLAGGLARRMGGGDKALRTIGGTSILGRIIAVTRPQCAGLLLNANGDVARLGGFGLPVAADNVAGFKGPLAGILAGLDWIALHHPGINFAISIPTDTPFLPANLVARLEEERENKHAEIVCARSGGMTHPVIALWPVSIRTDLRHALVDEDLRKTGCFTQRYHVATVDWPIEPYDPFFNANEPADLVRAEAILAQRAEVED
ncbi:molybdenum cofactor guanylyltransferase MobA [Methylocapsa sp. D3K7]|uniref:molybdenum cofactor guanylyltransferase MobA n=1 Tax=Methylocapsa sp. D3K7 TaxID=3041435 RepID=UPI00244EC527|nr:molybdenum cofactor guanylyltransferase MobA [Methylocapsa sp. D3K7]WGJ13223.1 molybdenum cofactor guanylyltransferase MobA [Methylocapsa sp. D3K7]